MIPSEFNQDIMAQRRKLHMLHEARISPGAVKRGREQSRSWKVGDRVRVAPNSQLGKDFGVEGLSTSGTVTSVKGSANNVQLGVKWDGKKQNRGQTLASSVIKEEVLTEKVKIVGVDNKSGELFLLVPGGQKSEAGRRLAGIASFAGGTFKHPGRDRSGSPDVFAFKVPKLKPLALSQFLRKQLKGLFEETLDLTERDATLDQGLTISKRKAGSGTWIKVERVSGKKYGVFRTFKKMKKIGKRPSTQISVPDEDAFAGPGSDPWAYHKDRDSALKLAREIAEKTGERVMIEDHKGRNVKLKLAFDSQQDASVFMSKFQFNGLFGGGALGKDLTPSGRMFTRITLKKSPFIGSEAYEQNVEVFPERLKAFLWQLGEAGGAIISERDKK